MATSGTFPDSAGTLDFIHRMINEVGDTEYIAHVSHGDAPGGGYEMRILALERTEPIIHLMSVMHGCNGELVVLNPVSPAYAYDDAISDELHAWARGLD